MGGVRRLGSRLSIPDRNCDQSRYCGQPLRFLGANRQGSSRSIRSEGLRMLGSGMGPLFRFPNWRNPYRASRIPEAVARRSCSVSTKRSSATALPHAAAFHHFRTSEWHRAGRLAPRSPEGMRGWRNASGASWILRPLQAQGKAFLSRTVGAPVSGRFQVKNCPSFPSDSRSPERPDIWRFNAVSWRLHDDSQRLSLSPAQRLPAP